MGLAVTHSLNRHTVCKSQIQVPNPKSKVQRKGTGTGTMQSYRPTPAKVASFVRRTASHIRAHGLNTLKEKFSGFVRSLLMIIENHL